jgi:hypothetical protein
VLLSKRICAPTLALSTPFLHLNSRSFFMAMHSSDSLKRHIQSHNGKTYKCDLDTCNESYKSKEGLAGHSRTHTQERLVCPANGCDKEFQSDSSLRKHKRRGDHTSIQAASAAVQGSTLIARAVLTPSTLNPGGAGNFPPPPPSASLATPQTQNQCGCVSSVCTHLDQQAASSGPPKVNSAGPPPPPTSQPPT